MVIINVRKPGLVFIGVANALFHRLGIRPILRIILDTIILALSLFLPLAARALMIQGVEQQVLSEAAATVIAAGWLLALPFFFLLPLLFLVLRRSFPIMIEGDVVINRHGRSKVAEVVGQKLVNVDGTRVGLRIQVGGDILARILAEDLLRLLLLLLQIVFHPVGVVYLFGIILGLLLGLLLLGLRFLAGSFQRLLALLSLWLLLLVAAGLTIHKQFGRQVVEALCLLIAQVHDFNLHNIRGYGDCIITKRVLI